MRRRALLTAVPPSLTGIAGCLDGQSASSSGESSAEREIPTGDAVRWIYETGGSVQYKPTLQGGVVYIPGGTNNKTTRPRSNFDPKTSENVYALSADDGSEKWQYEASAGVLSSPIFEGDVFIFVGWDTGQYRVAQRFMRLDDGVRTWKTELPNEYVHLLQISGGTAYLGTSNDEYGLGGETVLSIQTSDGDQRWSIEAGDTTEGFVSGDTLYIEEASQRTRALTVDDGSKRWEQAMEPPSGTPRVFGDTMYLVPNRENEDGNYPLVAVDVADGSERWRFSLPVDRRFLPTGAVKVDDTVCVTEYDGGLYSVSSIDGSEQWRYMIDDETRNQPVVVDGTAYLTGFNKGIHAIDVASGKRQWKQSAPASPRIVAGNTQGIIIRSVEDETQQLRAYAPDGTERWSFSHTGFLTQPAVQGTNVFVGTRTGYVIALGE